ncbi:MAG: hypothetical protein IJV77_01205 [Clostridia bacterium]|nr:hypothetical protein [Clostridia bacterium]
MILHKSNLDYDTLRKIVLKVIKQGNFNQYGNIEAQVAQEIKTCFNLQETNSFISSPSYCDLHKEDKEKVLEIIWDLIIQRVLTIGLDSSNNSWPFLRITEYGKKVVNQEEGIIVYDIDGMQKMLLKKVPNVDPVIMSYFIECLNTYRIGAVFASSVMLGCCAEKAICLLFDEYLEWLNIKASQKEYKNLENCTNRTISKKFQALTESICGHKSELPSNFFDDYDLFINAIFAIIRRNRNDAGHPTGKQVDRDEHRTLIYLFCTHCKKIYDLIQFLKTEREDAL